MSVKQLTERSRPDLVRGDPCVVVAATVLDTALRNCLESVLACTPRSVAVTIASTPAAGDLHELLEQCERRGHDLWTTSPQAAVDGATAAVEHALSLLGPADVALITEPCHVGPGWLERLREAAYADSNTASASALAEHGTPLALEHPGAQRHDPAEFAARTERVAKNSLRLRPRLNVAVGPCIYLRRDALELVGALDRTLQLRFAVEVDFAQRCVLRGLAHVAADDVLVEAFGDTREAALPLPLRQRYPYLTETSPIAASGVLPRALEAARRPRSRLWVTLDVRALTETLTGTQRHVLELAKALSATGRVRLRLLVAEETSAANVELLRALPQSEILPFDSIDEHTPRSTVFHRAQQVFAPPDLLLAQRLGERIVLNQLDLIAYRNPGYHRDATAWRSHRRVSRQALAAADRVVVFSEHTRAELLSDELAEDECIRIVPPGLDHPSSGLPSPPPELAGPGVAGGKEPSFLLCLGTDFLHKNRLFALRLLLALRERHGWRGRLVLAGTHIPHGSSSALERGYLERHAELDGAVLDLGAIAEEQKDWLMRHAAAVVYPSVYEGFGLVPFEAGLSGVPCVFAPRSSLAEVLPTEAAALVPWSPEESADSTYALLTDADERARQVQRLGTAARRLTWADAAAAIVEVYEQAAIAPVREAAKLSRDEVVREHELRELIAAQDAHVAQLVAEREHAQGMYDELNVEVGAGLGLIGPHGALPEDLQRGLLALSARPAVSRPVYGAATSLFRAARAAGRRLRER
jgi:glycosyltransferase involved in cell wall biosynthesis